MTDPAITLACPQRHIGKCIYCGSTDNLTDEHIVPHGLAGPWQLSSASCGECNKITSAFEGEVLRGFFHLVRTKLGLPTYHPRKRPQAFEFLLTKDGRESATTIPVADCPTLFMMPQFRKPGCITKSPQGDIPLITSMSLHGSGLERVKDRYNIDEISYNATLSTSFAKLLAKTAYGMTVAQYGLEAIDEAYVLPSILGQKHDVGRWVGCEESYRSPAELPPKERFLHRIDMSVRENEVGARVRLFANFQTPEYLVIVGRLK